MNTKKELEKTIKNLKEELTRYIEIAERLQGYVPHAELRKTVNKLEHDNASLRKELESKRLELIKVKAGSDAIIGYIDGKLEEIRNDYYP